MYNQNEHEFDSLENTDASTSREVPNWNAFDPPSVSESDNGEEFYYEEKSSRKKFLILPAVCLVAIAGIYFFGIKNGSKVASAAEKTLETQVDKALTRLTGNLSSRKLVTDAEQMIRAFNSFPVNQQVNSDELQKNPFTLDSQGAVIADPVESQPQGPTKEEIRKALQSRIASLALQSVIVTQKGGTCMIDGEIYRPGQTVGEFTIKEIRTNLVVLQSGDETFSLSM